MWSSFEGIVRMVKQRLCHWLAVIGRRYVPLNAATDGRFRETKAPSMAGKRRPDTTVAIWRTDERVSFPSHWSLLYADSGNIHSSRAARLMRLVCK